MTIYHFCAARHVKKIVRQGLIIGGVATFGKTGYYAHTGYTWLTFDGDPKRQSWATRITIPYSRTAYRLTVEIPEEETGNIMDKEALEKHLPGSKLLFEGWKGSENWRVYHGLIPPEWIKKVECMEE